MSIVLKKDQEIRDDDGNLVCRVARDVFAGEMPQVDQFKDWQGEPPQKHELVHPAILRAAGMTS